MGARGQTDRAAARRSAGKARGGALNLGVRILLFSKNEKRGKKKKKSNVNELVAVSNANTNQVLNKY